ncbi:hypothetical protein [Chitinophaga pinensis]|uniref:Uncharacterized protein n=1 Tax=Chitinophaga pinensis (strain ATCC 43595 / DSM 2588 / LMG 13176 / NBRC 15968 / NCIMB 11800 / UQM 2034) TaxID=485918 RepID=A0A979GY96_CHIPD|nr:hypothetical protein [Chitinophaga pinensis]ACU63079.1 hypothetical protein Cpin_5655 [Chitinophaga pinensis DSM 2588]
MKALAQILFIIICLIFIAAIGRLIFGIPNSKLDSVFNENDVFFNRRLKLERVLGKRFGNTLLLPSTISISIFLLTTFGPSRDYPFIVAKINHMLFIIVCWKAVSYKNLIIRKKTLIKWKAFLLVTVALSISHPFLLPLVLFQHIFFFNGWLHHSQLVSRIMMCQISFMISFSLSNLVLPEYSINILCSNSYVILLFSIVFSHYLIPGIGKVRIGKKWYSWIKNDQLQYLLSSAYIWGWCRFLPEKKVINFISRLDGYTIYLKTAAVMVECSTLFIMLDGHLAIYITLSVLLFQLSVFVFSGIFFFENILVLFTLLTIIPQLDDSYFGIKSFFISLLILIFPVNGLCWQPYKLSWWNAPLAGRIHWLVKGRSGKIYELHNDCFDAYERLFGRVYGYFLTDENIPYYHLGEIFEEQVKSDILETKGNSKLVAEIKLKHGKYMRNRQAEQVHDVFIMKYVGKLSKRKENLFVKFVNRLAFPGGQWYYWSDYPKYENQEGIEKLLIQFDEVYFTGKEFKKINTYIIKEIDMSLV